MKKLLYLVFISIFVYNLNAYSMDIDGRSDLTKMKLQITIGNHKLIATFENSETAKDFASLLPLKVNLNDYAKTEKVFNIPKKLSTLHAPSGIDPQVGDIAYYSPWGNVGIFYRDFGYSRGLVKIAHINSEIEILQIPGSIENVIFELIDND